MLYKKLNYITSTFLVLVIIILSQKCANRKPPSGGPKDVKPPKLLLTNPPDKSKNFNKKSIKFTFNEPITARNLKKEILINPHYSKKNLKFDSKKNELTLTFKDTLKKNKTYFLNLSNGIQDRTEGNKIKDLTYTFSTGNYIDTAKISGNVKNYWQNENSKNVIVGLYPYNDTINPIKNKPTYKTKTDTNGNFSIKYLEPDIYNIYSFNDKNNNNLFDINSEKLGFKTKPIKLYDKEEINLSLVKQDLSPPKYLTTLNEKNIKIKFNEPIYKYKISDIPVNLKNEISKENNLINIYNENYNKDSIKATIWVSDSARNDTTYNIKIPLNKPDNIKKEKVIKNITPKSGEKIDDSLNLNIKFNEPLKLLNKDTIFIIKKDSTNKNIISLKNKYLKLNEIKTELYFNKKVSFKDTLNLTFLENTFITIHNDTNSKKIIKYHKINKRNRSSFNLKIKTEKSPLIIQALNDKNQIIKEKYNTNKPLFKRMVPGTYSIRIIHDKNKNGYWDHGNFKKNIKPEKIKYFKNKIELKKRWDIKDVNIKF